MFYGIKREGRRPVLSTFTMSWAQAIAKFRASCFRSSNSRFCHAEYVILTNCSVTCTYDGTDGCPWFVCTRTYHVSYCTQIPYARILPPTLQIIRTYSLLSPLSPLSSLLFYASVQIRIKRIIVEIETSIKIIVSRHTYILLLLSKS